MTATPKTQATVDGAELLDRVAAWMGPYLSLPSEHCLPAIVLWAAHTHAADAFYVTPRLVLSSPEPGSGKTRVLELLNLISHQPQMIFSPTTAAIFRMLQDGPISLLFDEIDTVFGPKAGGNQEDLRALLNAGYKRGASIPRCVGDAAKMSVTFFRVFSPVAMGGLAGNLPATILTRAVVIHMRKRPQHIKVKPYEEEDVIVEATPLRDELQAWIDSQRPTLIRARPVMPAGVEDRPAEVWKALLAIADAAGGDWPTQARAACEHFVLTSTPATQSFGVRLLTDCRTAFADDDALPTTVLIDRLRADVEAPWADLTPMRLAATLREYEITSTNIRFGSPIGQAKGYRQSDFGDAWDRYCPVSSVVSPSRSSQPSQPSHSSSTPGRPESWDDLSRPTQDLVPALSRHGTTGTAGTAISAPAPRLHLVSAS